MGCNKAENYKLMNRRGFLRAAFALLGAPYIPAAQLPSFVDNKPTLTLDALKRAAAVMTANDVTPVDYFYAVIHPSTWDDMVGTLSPRETWKLAYREARMKLKNRGTPVLECGEIGSCRFIITASPTMQLESSPT